jgi:hypothetical protein
MIHLAESIAIEPGEVTMFEFEMLGLDGEIKVIWIDQAADAGTLLGLEYMHMEKTTVTGIPRFARE